MLKIFLLIPFFTLNVAMTLGLIYFTAFIDPETGFVVSLITVITLSCALVLVWEHKSEGQCDERSYHCDCGESLVCGFPLCHGLPILHHAVVPLQQAIGQGQDMLGYGHSPMVLVPLYGRPMACVVCVLYCNISIRWKQFIRSLIPLIVGYDSVEYVHRVLSPPSSIVCKQLHIYNSRYSISFVFNYLGDSLQGQAPGVRLSIVFIHLTRKHQGPPRK